jgi:excisionase family DNA binding protein
VRSDHPNPSRPIPRVTLALRAREAAKALSISVRLLATLTAENRIPHVRINTAVLYPTRELQDWLTEKIQKEGSP